MKRLRDICRQNGRLREFNRSARRVYAHDIIYLGSLVLNNRKWVLAQEIHIFRHCLRSAIRTSALILLNTYTGGFLVRFLDKVGKTTFPKNSMGEFGWFFAHCHGIYALLVCNIYIIHNLKRWEQEEETLGFPDCGRQEKRLFEEFWVWQGQQLRSSINPFLSRPSKLFTLSSLVSNPGDKIFTLVTLELSKSCIATPKTKLKMQRRLKTRWTSQHLIHNCEALTLSVFSS